MILKVRKSSDPILRQPTEKVTDFGHEFQFMIDNMIETMRKNDGIGLAAPQIGISKKVFVCEFSGDKDSDLPSFPLTIICNPEIVEASKRKVNMVEGCLSFPGMELLVKRPAEIIIKGQDRFGKNLEIKASKLYARVMQHEFDHLNSTLLIDKAEETSVVFIGTGSLGVKALELLASDHQYKMLAVVTSDEFKVVSRKVNKENLIAKTAKRLKLPLIQTKNINSPETVEKIKKLKPELGVMADFGQIVSEEILNIPKHGIINIHPSILPRHRGPSPIQQTILDGDKITGVSLILTSSKMDAGGIISQTAVELSHAETSTILKEYLSEVGAVLLMNSLPYYLASDLKPFPQKEDQATYTRLIKSLDGYVDSNTPAIEVERKIRAFDEWPKVYTEVKGKRIQITAAHFEENGRFIIDRVKPEGKKEMNYSDYLHGRGIELTFQ